jgi:hypothetical protein
MPEDGLDCVGLVAWALAGGGWRGEVPSGYRLRGGDPGRVAALIECFGLVRVADGRAGDVALAASGPGQVHLVILTGDGIVHADAMLRRVVERPGAVPWPVIGYWRFEGEA